MYYVEMLRALRALKIFAIILGSLFLIALLLRISVNKHLDPGKYLNNSRTAVKTERVETDGSKTTIIDDRAKGTHVEIHQDLGVYRVTIVEKSSAASRKHAGSHRQGEEGGSMGVSISDEDVAGVGHVTTIERNTNVSLDVLLMIGSFLAAFVATVLGSALSKENEHLELAWTKPVARESYALAAIGIDIAGILVSFGLAICAMVAITALFGIPHVVTSGQTALIAAIAIVFPLSWYAVLQGVTASLRRASLALGLSWPIAFALAALAQLKWSLQPVVQFIDTFNPIAYFTRATAGSEASNSALTLIHGTSDSTNVVMLFVLTLLGIIAAVVQWRRLEA